MRPIGTYSRSTCAFAADQVAELVRESSQEAAQLLMLAVLNFPKEIIDAISAGSMENGGVETNRQKQLDALANLFSGTKFGKDKCAKIHSRLVTLVKCLRSNNAALLVFALMKMPEEVLSELERIAWAMTHGEEKKIGEFLAWCRDRVEYPCLQPGRGLLNKAQLELFIGPKSNREVF